MGIFKNFGNGCKLFWESIRAVRAYPKFLVPMFMSWIPIAAISLYVTHYASWPKQLLPLILMIFGILFAFTVLIFVSNSILLEMIEHIETGGGTIVDTGRT